MTELPMIRLEVERMKHSVLHAFDLYAKETSDRVAQEIDAALESFDWSGVVREAVHDAVREAIDHHFRYGDGRTAINAAITEALGRER